jgi:hypothetical protein
VEIRDAVAKIVYQRVLDHPESFPPEVVKAAQWYFEFWGDDERGKNVLISERWEKFLQKLKHTENLTEILEKL